VPPCYHEHRGASSFFFPTSPFLTHSSPLAQLGFSQVLTHPNLVTHLTYSLYIPSSKLRALVADVLAAICVLSSDEGHSLVLSAFSDARIAHNEKFRFEFLVDSIKLPEHSDDETSDGRDEGEVDEAGIWEWRTAGMALVNALTNTPNDLEERIMLRDEFTRRGLNEAIVVCPSSPSSPSRQCLIDSLRSNRVFATSLLPTTSSRRSRSTRKRRTRIRRNCMNGLSDRRGASAFSPSVFSSTSLGKKPDALPPSSTSSVPLPELIRLAQEHQDTYPQLIQTVKTFLGIFERKDINDEFRNDLVVVLERFIEHATHLEDFDQGWRTFMRQYLASVQHLVGQQSVIRSSRVADTASVPTSFLEELEGLRTKVDELSEERTALRAELHEQIAETNTLRGLPAELNHEPGDRVRRLFLPDH
jgi:diaphanous 1